MIYRRFSGVSQYVSIPAGALTVGSSNFCLEMWFKKNTTGTGYYTLASSNYGSDGYAWYINQDKIELWDTGALVGKTTGTVSYLGWDHLSVSRSGNTVYASINGSVEVINASFAPSLGVDGVSGIGYNGSGSYAQADICHVARHSVAKYTANFDPVFEVTGSPDHYWKLDETAGSTAVDSAGIDDGTYNGPTYREDGLPLPAVGGGGGPAGFPLSRVVN